MMKKFLSNEGHDLIIAENGELALETLNQKPLPDIILLDIVMEGMDGFELIKRIKNDARFKKIPVVFVTSLDKGSDITNGLSLGASDYIIKPFTANELKNKIMDNLVN